MKQEPCWQVRQARFLILLMVGLNQLNLDSKTVRYRTAPQ